MNLSSLLPSGTSSSGGSDIESFVKQMLGNDYATLFPSSSANSPSTSVVNTNSSQFMKTSQYDLDTTRIGWRALAPYQDIIVNNVYNNKT